MKSSAGEYFIGSETRERYSDLIFRTNNVHGQEALRIHEATVLFIGKFIPNLVTLASFPVAYALESSLLCLLPIGSELLRYGIGKSTNSFLSLHEIGYKGGITEFGEENLPCQTMIFSDRHNARFRQ